jgi:hypothetical protein
MAMTKPMLWGGGVVLLILLFCGWYSVADNYGDGAISGIYALRSNVDASTVVLRPDHSFQQELNHSGEVKHAEGRWHRSGESGIEFSKEFLKVSGQELGPQGEAFGHVKRKFGLFLSIALNPEPGGPTFQKKLFN